MHTREVLTVSRNIDVNTVISIIRTENTIFNVKSYFDADMKLADILLATAKENMQKNLICCNDNES